MTVEPNWRKAKKLVEETGSVLQLAELEVAEHQDGSPRTSVLAAIGTRAGHLVFAATDDEKLAALEVVSRVPNSKVLAAIEGWPSTVTDDDGHGSHESGSGGHPSVTSGLQPVNRPIGRLVRRRAADGSITVTCMAYLRRK